MKIEIGLKPRKTADFSPEKLREILSCIYTEEVVEELIGRFVEKPEPAKGG